MLHVPASRRVLVPQLVALSLLVALFFCPAAWAQNRGRWQPPRNISDLKATTVTGKIENVQGNVLAIKIDTGHPYFIGLFPELSKLGISGTAEPSYLKPGMLVSFTADIDVEKKGAEVAEPLKELAVISKSETNTPGVFPEDRENKESTRFFVRGIVKSMKDDTLAVSAGGKQITAKVASDAAIKIESADLSIVRPGDEISVDGRVYKEYRSENNNIQPGMVIGEKVDIKLAETLNADTFKKKPKAAKD